MREKNMSSLYYNFFFCQVFVTQITTFFKMNREEYIEIYKLLLQIGTCHHFCTRFCMIIEQLWILSNS